MGGRGRGRGGAGGGKSAKVGFAKPAEPSFIRKLKEQHGYKVNILQLQIKKME